MLWDLPWSEGVPMLFEAAQRELKLTEVSKSCQ